MNVGSSSSGISLLASSLFSKLDTKQKGYLEQSDMQSALSSASSSSSSTDISETFTQLDADSDGKVTQTELSKGLQSLVDALQGQLRQSQLHDGPPPPPPGDSQNVDEGFTQDELSSMAADSKTDSKRAELMSKLADNFEAADTDGNGKVNREEAMAYDRSTRTNSNSTTQSSDTESLNLNAMVQMLQLLQAYGVTDSASSSVSLAA